MKLCPQCRAPIEAEGWTCAACGFAPEDRDGILSFYEGETEGYAEEFFENLRQAPPDHFWFVNRRALIRWAVAKFCPSARNYLEIGCGNGDIPLDLARSFPDLSVTATDSLWDGLRHLAASGTPMELLRLDARRLPFQDHYDIVAAYDVIEHIEDDRSALRNLANAARPGGHIFITVPQHMFLWSALDDYSGHQRRYSRRELADKARECGIEPVFMTSFVSVLLPVMLAVRKRKQDKVDSPTDEMTLAPLANGILNRLMSLERVLIRAGISLPAGGSLLMVGRVRD